MRKHVWILREPVGWFRGDVRPIISLSISGLRIRDGWLEIQDVAGMMTIDLGRRSSVTFGFKARRSVFGATRVGWRAAWRLNGRATPEGASDHRLRGLVGHECGSGDEQITQSLESLFPSVGWDVGEDTSIVEASGDDDQSAYDTGQSPSGSEQQTRRGPRSTNNGPERDDAHGNRDHARDDPSGPPQCAVRPAKRTLGIELDLAQDAGQHDDRRAKEDSAKGFSVSPCNEQVSPEQYDQDQDLDRLEDPVL